MLNGLFANIGIKVSFCREFALLSLFFVHSLFLIWMSWSVRLCSNSFWTSHSVASLSTAVQRAHSKSFLYGFLPSNSQRRVYCIWVVALPLGSQNLWEVGGKSGQPGQTQHSTVTQQLSLHEAGDSRRRFATKLQSSVNPPWQHSKHKTRPCECISIEVRRSTTTNKRP